MHFGEPARGAALTGFDFSRIVRALLSTTLSPPWTRRDTGLALLLFAATVAYVAAWPRSLGLADESYFLYEAERIRTGEVMYRDFFQFVTPLPWYVMGLAFRLFGTQVWTARLVMAAVHGAIALLIYAAARGAGARRGLALVGAASAPALAFSIWPIASPHWFATAGCMLLLWAALRVPWSERPATAAVLGGLVALLVVTQQQKGVVFGAGSALLVGLDALGEARDRLPGWLGRGAQRCLWLAIGFAVVFLPCAALVLLGAGVDPVYDALVRYPLQEYNAKRAPMPWAGFGALTLQLPAYTWPAVLRGLPWAFAVPLAAALWELVRGQRRRALRCDLAIGVLGATAIFSIWYYPDAVHVAFILPLAAVAAAASVERLLAALPARPGAAVGLGLTAVGLAALAPPLWRHQAMAHAAYPLEHDTAFGRLRFAQPTEVALVDALRQRLDAGGDRALFAYNLAAPYLLAGAHNPTRYQHLSPRFHRRERLEETAARLQEQPPPYVVVLLLSYDTVNDPLAKWIGEHYDVVPYAPQLTSMLLLARRDPP
ncbi:MAG: hypothetical protein SF182_11365 [Deltaproteobacteria bacterium]|nr:hypothetical protein [Deltaproteobacteria bacterium]